MTGRRMNGSERFMIARRFRRGRAAAACIPLVDTHLAPGVTAI